MITDLYEIQVTCVNNENNNFNKIKNFIDQNIGELEDIGLKETSLSYITHRYGDFKEKPMLRANFESNNINQVINLGKEIKEEMIGFGIHGTYRIRVLLKSQNNIPEAIDLSFHTDGTQKYYEFTWDVVNTNPYDNSDLETLFYRLENDSIEFGVHLSYDEAKDEDEQYPLATLRYYDTKKSEAAVSKDFVLALLRNKKWGVFGDVQLVVICYDDNIMMDRGWIFESKPNSISTRILM